MAKSTTVKSSARKRKAPIRMCCDRVLTGTEKVRAMHAAVLENSKNMPPPTKRPKLFGASSMSAPLKMALEAGKKWADGKTLGVWFKDGSATQRQRVIAQAMKWTNFANVKFKFTATKAAAHIR